VRDEHQAYAEGVAEALSADGIRVVVDPAVENVGARIRRAKLQKVPYILVVGEQDARAGTVGVNRRGSEAPERDVPVEEFRRALRDEVAERRTGPAPAEPT
jgi:threonyl-tRNA synthetase